MQNVDRSLCKEVDRGVANYRTTRWNERNEWNAQKKGTAEKKTFA